MKKKAENSTTNYDPEKITDAVEINFTKIASPGKTVISGTIRKSSEDVGSVSLDTKDNYLITSLKPHSSLTAEEVKAVYDAVPGCITEMLND